MTTTNMFLNFGGKWDSPPLLCSLSSTVYMTMGYNSACMMSNSVLCGWAAARLVCGWAGAWLVCGWAGAWQVTYVHHVWHYDNVMLCSL